MAPPNQNGWNEYSRLVLKELETLSDNIESLKDDIRAVNQEIAKLQAKEDKVDELRQWKDKIDEITSPSQLQTSIKDINDLKIFKTKAITVFAVVQFMMVVVTWAMKFLE